MTHSECIVIGNKTYRIEWDKSSPWTGYKIYAGCICVGGARTFDDARRLAQIDYDIFYRDGEKK